MNTIITGNTVGLKPKQRQSLESLYRNSVNRNEIISTELAHSICRLSRELNRQIGLLITTRGHVDHVIVGDASQIFLPNIGRLRGGDTRLRGLRLVHTHLRGESLTQDDLTDLTLLRLDLVSALEVRPNGNPGNVFTAHLTPDPSSEFPWEELPPVQFSDLALNVTELTRSLSVEIARNKQLTLKITKNKTKALLVHVDFRKNNKNNDDTKSEIIELKELCKTAGLHLLDIIEQTRHNPDPKFLIGKGKLQTVLLRAMQLDVDMVVFSQNLSPSQTRAISSATDLKIIDRTMLILDIFSQHAKTQHGKLQVELAQLHYLLPHLNEKNTMMSRLAGGIGGRGPGETKLEINRRHIDQKISTLKRRISQAQKTRQLHQQGRTTSTVSLIGYTNAGKSTLFNQLTHADVLVANKLFATLTPTNRRLRFSKECEVVLTDTVGFIRNMPQSLLDAFRATFEEISEASLLLHVVDASATNYVNHIDQVRRILKEFDLAEKDSIILFNKTELLSPKEVALRIDAYQGIAISALNPSTLSPVLEHIKNHLLKT